MRIICMSICRHLASLFGITNVKVEWSEAIQVKLSPLSPNMETTESEKQNMNSNVTVSESDGKSLLENSEIESFYQRLIKLHSSSGINLVFDLRQSMLDLHLCYKEVTARGGFIQVTADARWGEVALALKLDGDNLQDPQPLLNLYVHILYQYEKLYYYREPHVKAAFTLGHAFYNIGDVSAIERKCTDNSSQMLLNLENALVEKKMAKENWQPTLIGSTSAEQKQFPQLHSQKKEMKRRRGFPRGTQSAYTIFLRKECERLKNSASEQLKGQRILDLAVKAWRCLSESEKQPYIEASKRVNEKRAAQEMMADEENHGMQNAERGKKPSQSHNGNFRAALQSDTEKSCVQNQAVNFQESLLEGIDWSK